jgi:hypothetical protein
LTKGRRKFKLVPGGRCGDQGGDQGGGRGCGAVITITITMMIMAPPAIMMVALRA